MTTDFKTKFTTKEIIKGKPTLVISSNGVDKLKSEVVKVDNQVDDKIDNEIDNEIIQLLDKNIEALQGQLEAKDNQINELNQRLKEQQELNRNNQVLLLREKESNKKQQLESKEQKESRSILEKFKDMFKK